MRFHGGLGPVLRARAQDVIDHPEDWRLGGALVWYRTDGLCIADQAVEWVRKGHR